MRDVIAVDSLTKRYDDLIAVDGISFSVRSGEVFGILGPNGAGKTTTLECIEGITAPTSGMLSVLGMDIARESVRIKRRIGVQLQASAYFDYLKLGEILDLFARIYDIAPRAEELLDTVGLRDRANTTVAKLSGGQQQRFAIAAALVNDPEIVFLDEPTAGLDPQSRRNLWELVRALHDEGRTVVLTTHYIEEAEFLCDRVAIMDGGRIVTLDTPDNLVRSLPVPYRISVELKGGGGGIDSLPAVVDVVTNPAKDAESAFVLHSSNSAETIPALMEWLSDTGSVLTHLQITPASLEDVFLSLTGRELEN